MVHNNTNSLNTPLMERPPEGAAPRRRLYSPVAASAAGRCRLLLGGRVVLGPEYGFALVSFSVYLVCVYIVLFVVLPAVEASAVLALVTRSSGAAGLLFMVFTATSDPGAIQPPRPEEAPSTVGEPPVRVVTYRGVELRQKWCSSCGFYGPLRSSHCRVTDMHVSRFDHLCTFLGTAIGAQNYRWFLGSVYCVTLFALCSTALCARFLREASFLAAVASHPEVAATLVVSAGAFLAFGLLVFYHTYITSKNLTMNEQIKKRFANSDNPFDSGSLWRNFLAVLLPLQGDPEPTKVPGP